MKTKAAVVVEFGKPFEIEELSLDLPQENEVLVRYEFAGMCHSDLHILNGDFPATLPQIGGHEGGGVVEEIGPGVTRLKAGDHVACSFVPVCGTCRWCSTGQQAICDWGATILEGCLPPDRWPISGPRGRYGATSMVGTFSQYGTVHQNSLVKIADDLPLDLAALVSCGVTTGWGSAVYAADVRPGETVIVYGIGGVGINAVQGASYAGAQYVIAVDPLTNKREAAGRFGATHTASTNAEAHEIAQELTNGLGADKAIVAPGIVHEPEVSAAFEAIRKAGTMVMIGMGSLEEKTIQLPSAILGMYKKTIKGSLFGDANPMHDIPKILDLWRGGKIQLDELVTTRYRLEDVNQGYADMEAGKNIRGVIEIDH